VGHPQYVIWERDNEAVNSMSPHDPGYERHERGRCNAGSKLIEAYKAQAAGVAS
jgi:hypothetical protein